MTWGAIVAFITALPKILALVEKIEKDLGPNWTRIAEDALTAYTSLRNAKTPEEHDDALKRISDSWSNNKL